MEKYLDHEKANKNNKSKQVWDCGSTLYDSFELNSFKKQLDSAIACSRRSISMPHLPEHRAPLPPLKPPQKQPIVDTKKPSKSLGKLIRSFFRIGSKKSNLIGSIFRLKDQSNKDGSFYVVYDKSGALTTIPELPEIDFGGLSPEIGSLVRKTCSERLTPNSINISCAHQ